MKIGQIQTLTTTAYKIPADFPESDGTLEWDSTTLILVEIAGMGKTGIGYTYADEATASFIERKLKPILLNQQPFAIAEAFQHMRIAIRNEGQCGIAFMALSAVDIALWDLKAQILELPLCQLIGQARQEALVYGSGGFTSYPDDRLAEQLGNWAAKGFSAVKMKIGREPEKDGHRIQVARKAIGDKTGLFMDANGAFSAKQALDKARQFEQYGIDWFEEPVSSDDVCGLRFIREHAPAGMKIAAGEYGYKQEDFLALLVPVAVDVLQADATRCGGITGFLKAGSLSEAFHKPFSFHCAPAIHLHAAVCLSNFYIGEYFYDHARIEQLFFDGVVLPVAGCLKPDMTRPGLGLIFKHADAEPYKVS